MTLKSPHMVQIALPTYNGARYIGEALASLLFQTHEDLAVHVMDNASTDGTSDIVADVVRRDRRVVHHRSTDFVSATDNWLRAFDRIDRARSDYFMWASDDDRWDARFVAKLVADLVRDEEAVLAFPQYRSIDGDGRPGALFYDKGFPADSRFRQMRRLIEYGRYSAIYGVMRTRALDWRPILHEASFGADLWFLMNLSSRGRFAFRPEPLFYKRTGGMSETNTDASASADPDRVWLLGEDERRMIMDLSFTRAERIYLFNRLRVAGKILHPDKAFGPLVAAWALLLLLKHNPRALGLRARLFRPTSAARG